MAQTQLWSKRNKTISPLVSKLSSKDNTNTCCILKAFPITEFFLHYFPCNLQIRAQQLTCKRLIRKTGEASYPPEGKYVQL